MIVCIAFRHGTEDKILKRRIELGCHALPDLLPNIRRASVIFDSVHEHDDEKPSKISCHISISGVKKIHFDVYKCELTQEMAFDRAFETVMQVLERKKPHRAANQNSWDLAIMDGEMI